MSDDSHLQMIAVDSHVFKADGVSLKMPCVMANISVKMVQTSPQTAIFETQVKHFISVAVF